MNLFFLFGLFLSMKYTDEKALSDESKFHSNKTEKIDMSILSVRCEGCCDDLNDDYELREKVELRLDLNYFNNREALKRRETNIYNDMKTCVNERPLLSCVDLCLCKKDSCIYQLIFRARIVHKAYHCTKEKIRTKFKNQRITLSVQNSSPFTDCWQDLSEEEILKIIHKFSSTNLVDQDKSLNKNSIEPSPMSTNGLSSSLSQIKLIIIALILKQFIFQVYF